jgi:Fe-S-cluster-containing hydrogenase component 2
MVDSGRRAFLRGRFLRTAATEEDDAGPRIAVLDRGTCMAWDGVICISCRLACDEQAIRFDDRRPTIVDSACTGCTDCVDVCPSRAIRMQSAPPPSAG